MFTMKWDNMFCNFPTEKHQYESDKLPTAKMALDQRVLQAHYAALTRKSAHIHSPILPDPQEYGWTLNKITNLYHPIMTKNLLVSDTVVELSLCFCKTRCTQRRCICKKNNLLCTDSCVQRCVYAETFLMKKATKKKLTRIKM